jgi:hypothetical protein
LPFTISEIFWGRYPVLAMAVWAETTDSPQLGKYRELRKGSERHAGSVSCLAVLMKNSLVG